MKIHTQITNNDEPIITKYLTVLLSVRWVPPSVFLPIVSVVGLIVGTNVGDPDGLSVDGVIVGSSVGSMDDVDDIAWIDDEFVGDTEGTCTFIDVVESSVSYM